MLDVLEQSFCAEHTSAFDGYHPVVALLCFALLLAFAMFVMQPVYLVLTFLGAFAYGALLRGWRGACHGLMWQLPAVLLLAVINPLFVSAGSTELFRIGTQAFYLESLIYGACQGLLLASVLLLFQNAAAILSFDKVQAVCGNVLPTVSLMSSMVMRLVPQFARRGHAVNSVMGACTAAGGGTAGELVPSPTRRPARVNKHPSRRGSVAQYLRLSTVLMAWGMEDSLESAQVMQARAWGSAAKRTTYQRYRFCTGDAVVCALLFTLALASACAAWAACSAWSFYPKATGLAPWFSYAPYALLVFFPALLEAYEHLGWAE